jgi:hypothetical protein
MARKPGELFTFADFSDLPPAGVATTLSRLNASGKIRKAHKGVYYVPRETVLGEVPVDPVALTRKIAPEKSFLTGLAASNALGLTTQVPARTMLALEGMRPSGISGVEFSKRNGTYRKGLTPKESALFEVLRSIGNASDLAPGEQRKRLSRVVENSANPDRLLAAAMHEPPRVRAMLGALADNARVDSRNADRLRKSLNPVSRYEFGPLESLPTAHNWQAKRHAA